MGVNYRRCYKVLQLESGASWEELRKRYKHLVQHCHPDRFQNNPDALIEAEANLREFNAAYSILADYYRRNERLPLGEDSSHTNWEFQNTSELKDREEQFRTARRWAILNFRVSQWAVFAVPASMVLLVVGFLVVHSDDENGVKSASIGDAAILDVPGHPLEPVPQASFGYSDTWKQVLDIQGEPTSMSENIWFYGKSRVNFEHGHVVGWKQHMDNPLRVRGEVPGMVRLIQIGDTKDDVLDIQGEPLMKSGRRWEYGPSFIEFKGDRVIRWHSSVLRPLAVGQPGARED